MEEKPQKTREELTKEARNLALHRLGRRESSRREIISYLQGKGIPTSIAEEVTEVLVRDNLIDDTRYARMYTRQQAQRGKGSIMIRHKLRAKGVSMDLTDVKSLTEEVSEETELQAARKILERRYPRHREDRAEAQRAFQALLRRGYSSDTARKALFSKPEEEESGGEFAGGEAPGDE